MRQAVSGTARAAGLLLIGGTMLAGCADLPELDLDLRAVGGGFDTSAAVAAAVAERPQPDIRGVVSYPGYQVALARRGDTVRDVAVRVGLPPAEVARYNALPENAVLNDGALVALPSRVSEPDGTRGAAGQGIDVATIAGAAIDRADAGPGLPSSVQPTRHRVAPGETAFSIARAYDVPVAALAEWNGLGPDLAIRQGQYLLIPVRTAVAEVGSFDEDDTDGRVAVAALPPAAPGTGSATPLPPSSKAPLPPRDEAPRSDEIAAAPASDPGAARTEVSDTARLRMPVSGRIVRSFSKGKSDGIGIAAAAGSPVVAADEGSVAAITEDTDGVPILVLRHEGNLLTVYAGVDAIAVKKGDRVTRGQRIAAVRKADPSLLHFEVREGFDSVDPGPYLN